MRYFIHASNKKGTLQYVDKSKVELKTDRVMVFKDAELYRIYLFNAIGDIIHEKVKHNLKTALKYASCLEEIVVLKGGKNGA